MGLSQAVNFSKLMNIVFEKEKQMSIYGVFLSVDLEYGSMSLVDENLRKGVRSATFFPSHITSCHPFVLKSVQLLKRKPGFDEDDIDGGIITGTGWN